MEHFIKIMFLDIGFGVLISIFVGKLYNLPLEWTFVLAGAVFALLVDADYTLHYLVGGSSKNAYKHRFYFHFPLIYLPLGVFVISLFGAHYALLFGLCALMHFIHDSIGIGWGIQWLYPFNTNHYSFFYIYQAKNKPLIPKKLIYTWAHNDLESLTIKHGDENWLKNVYGKLHPYAIAEYLVFIVAIITLYYNFR